MAHPDIPGLVQRLRKLIETSKTRNILESGEGVTRSALIDPMLRELGWDTSDPTMVWPEYPLDSGGKADYALLSDGKPVIFLEVKKLGDGLADAIDQGVDYCQEENVNLLVVTDGNAWFLYESPKGGSQSPTPIATFTVRSTEIEKLSEQVSLLLWSELKTPRRENYDQETNSEWSTLEKWSKAKGERRPSVMKFPDSSLFPVNHREDLVLNTVKWLEKEGLLESLIPVSAGGSARTGTRRFLVADQQEPEPGKPMAKPEKVGKYYVDVAECRRGPVEKARSLLMRAGVQPSSVGIKYT